MQKSRRAAFRSALVFTVLVFSNSARSAPIDFVSGAALVNFGETATPKANLIRDPERGQVLNLVNQSGQVLNASIEIVKPFNHLDQTGTSSPSAQTGLPGSVTRDGFYGTDQAFLGHVNPLAQIEISGLNPAYGYDLVFFASRMNSPYSFETSYTARGAGGGTALLEPRENLDRFATIRAIRPTASGRITIDVRKGPKNNTALGFYFIGSLQIIPVRETFINFGKGDFPTPSGWNDTSPMVTSGSIALRTSQNVATPVKLTAVTPFNSVNNGGTVTPAASIGFPPDVARKTAYGNSVAYNGKIAPSAKFDFSGLDVSASYDFRFFASRMGSTDNRSTRYTVAGLSTIAAILEPKDNQSRIAYVAPVRPTAAGKLSLTVTKGAGNTSPYGFFHLAGLRMTEHRHFVWPAAAPTTGCIPSTISGSGTTTLRTLGTTPAPYGFIEYLPPGYSSAANAGKKWPLILMLHGSGERGDGTTQLAKAGVHGPNRRIREGRQFPAIIITPQQPPGSYWVTSTMNQFVTYLFSAYRIDSSRFYLTGLSMGGLGAWNYLRAYPEKIAAAVPICGPAVATKTTAEKAALTGLPIYAVNNLDDPAVSYLKHVGLADSLGAAAGARNEVLDGYRANASSVDTTSVFNYSTRLWEFDLKARQLRNSNGTLRSGTRTIFSFPQRGGHDAWTATYAAEDTWNWLFCQHR